MPRVNPYSLPRAARPAVYREFEDPNTPGNPLCIKVQALDAPDQSKAFGRARDLIAKYVGDAEDGTAPTAEFPTGLIGEITLSAELMQQAALTECMQVPDARSGEPYSAEELIVLSVTMPRAWQDLQSTVAKLQNQYLGKGGSPADDIPTSTLPTTPS